MDSNLIIRIVSDTQDAGILALTQVAIILGSIGTIIGGTALAYISLLGKKGPPKPKTKKIDKELSEYLKKEGGDLKLSKKEKEALGSRD